MFAAIAALYNDPTRVRILIAVDMVLSSEVMVSDKPCASQYMVELYTSFSYYAHQNQTTEIPLQNIADHGQRFRKTKEIENPGLL